MAKLQGWVFSLVTYWGYAGEEGDVKSALDYVADMLPPISAHTTSVFKVCLLDEQGEDGQDFFRSLVHTYVMFDWGIEFLHNKGNVFEVGKYLK
jgi:hypothetical protein